MKIDRCIKAAAKAFNVSISGLYGRGRAKEYTRARHACWLLAVSVGYTLNEIAGPFDRHNGTIWHGVERGREMLRDDPGFGVRYKEAYNRIIGAR